MGETLTARQPLSMRSVHFNEEGKQRFMQTMIHRYSSAGGVDVPQTESTFGPDAVVEVDRMFRRQSNKPVWRHYVVYIARPAIAPGSCRADYYPAQVLIYKAGMRKDRIVNMRKEDLPVALKAGRL